MGSSSSHAAVAAAAAAAAASSAASVHGLSSLSQAEFRRKLRLFMQDKTSLRIFLFLCINFLFMFVELVYGYFSNSLGLISDAGHMLFDCTALAIGLYASFVAKIGANPIYTYGYHRYEIISGYVNGVFLLFIGYFILVESVERLFKPPEIASESLVWVSAIGFVVNIIGLTFFHDHGGHGHSHGGHGHSHGGGGGHGHSVSASGGGSTTACTGGHGGHGAHGHGDEDHEDHDDHAHSHGGHGGHGGGVSCSHNHGSSSGDDYTITLSASPSPLPAPSGGGGVTPHHSKSNIDGIFLHILADTLGSVGVIISSLLVQHFGWTSADAICSMIISLLIVGSVIPLLRNTTDILLNRTPDDLAPSVDSCLQQIRRLHGVVHIERVHFWRFTETDIIGSLHITIVEENTINPDIANNSSSINNNSWTMVRKEASSAPSSQPLDQHILEQVKRILKDGDLKCANLTVQIQTQTSA